MVGPPGAVSSRRGGQGPAEDLFQTLEGHRDPGRLRRGQQVRQRAVAPAARRAGRSHRRSWPVPIPARLVVESQLSALAQTGRRHLHRRAALAQAVDQAVIPVGGAGMHLEHHAADIPQNLVDGGQDPFRPGPPLPTEVGPTKEPS